MARGMPFARAVVRKGIIRSTAGMNVAGIVACTGYFCLGRTFEVF